MMEDVEGAFHGRGFQLGLVLGTLHRLQSFAQGPATAVIAKAFIANVKVKYNLSSKSEYIRLRDVFAPPERDLFQAKPYQHLHERLKLCDSVASVHAPNIARSGWLLGFSKGKKGTRNDNTTIKHPVRQNNNNQQMDIA